MADTKQRAEGHSAIAHHAAQAWGRLVWLFVHLIFDLFAIGVLADLMGDTNGAVFLSIVIVVGAEIGLRKFEKKKHKFGDTARGTEVADHTKEGQ